MFRWTFVDHWTHNDKQVLEASESEVPNPITDFSKIMKMDNFSICIMENFHFFLNRENPDMIALVKKFSRHCNQRNKTVIFANSVMEYPREVEAHLTVLDHDLPSTEDINNVIDSIADSVKDKKVSVKLTEDRRHRLTDALKGMRAVDIENALAYSIVTTKDFDDAVLRNEKCKTVRKTGYLEVVKPPHSFKDVGGYDRAKQVITRDKIVLSPQAKKWNLSNKISYLFLGVSGGGKSYFVQACGAELNLPVLRLKMGEMFGSLVGESEKNIRNALKLADSMAPCILWIDEWDKGMSGTGGSGSTDGGTTVRVGGEILQWMNDHQSLVIVMATANEIDHIPVEYMRKGRFSEIVFFDIPNNIELADIFQKQFVSQKLDPSKYDIKKLVEEAKQFTGAEVAAVIDTAKKIGANRGEFPNTEDIITVIKETEPEAKKNKSKVDSIRQRAAQVAIPASFEEQTAPSEVTTKDGKWKNRSIV